MTSRRVRTPDDARTRRMKPRAATAGNAAFDPEQQRPYKPGGPRPPDGPRPICKDGSKNPR